MIPAEVLSSWSSLEGRPVFHIAVGNINQTYRVEGALGRVIVQKVHPVFGPEVHADIDAVTRHLQAKGLQTPRLIPTDEGALFVTDAAGGVWRAQTFVEGVNVEKAESEARARAAGVLSGRFHVALLDLEHRYAHVRGNVHDTPSHLARLRGALDTFKAHRLYDAVAPVAEKILLATASLPDFSTLAPRHSHGDLKISNLMFDAEGEGTCLIDLDTLSLMIWPYEVGDALRSWCNPRAEDERPVRFESELFVAALDGYASVADTLPTDDELALLLPGVRTICLELSARFLDDALRESYFGFDEKRYPTAGDHHLARGLAMQELAASVDDQRDALERDLARAFHRD